MSKLGEGLRNIAGAATDSIGVSGFKAGWDNVRTGHHSLRSVPAAAGLGALGGVETFVFPNSVRDFVVEDYVSTYSEYQKGRASIVASLVLDGLSITGAVGVGILTKQLEAAIAVKVGLNAATSLAVRIADSIQKRKAPAV